MVVPRCITETSLLARRALVVFLLLLNVMLNLNVSMELSSSAVVMPLRRLYNAPPSSSEDDSIISSSVDVVVKDETSTNKLRPIMELLSLSFEERATMLETTITPYYVYNDENITFDNSRRIQKFVSICKDSVKFCPRYLPSCYDALSEQSVLQSLKSHPWNINNNNNNNNGTESSSNTSLESSSMTMIHVIPTPMIALMYVNQHSKIRSNSNNNCIESQKLRKRNNNKKAIFDIPFTTLTTHPRFRQQESGRYHVIIGVHYDLFASHRNDRVPQLAKWYPTLQNITVAHHYDAINCRQTVAKAAAAKTQQQGRSIGGTHDKGSSSSSSSIASSSFSTTLPQPQPNHEYLPTFAVRKPVVGHSFVLGLGIADISVPLQIPTIDKFYPSDDNDDNEDGGGSSSNSEDHYYIFYRTRTQPSKFNSTIYRLAPINMVDATKHPIFNSTYSSIGYDLPHDTWVNHISNSKFCLAIRGDTPHTHALLRSIRAGCLPVVISDYYPMFASSFANIISMEEYCIFISEQTFISNPTQALLSLQDVPRDVIESKLQGLQFVQRILFPDHPQTLFVPAFLQQTLHANERK